MTTPESPATDPDDDGSTSGDAEAPLLSAPSGGLPTVVVDDAGLAASQAALAAGHGPIAIDAERAHGFRYSTRAYLIQLKRAGAGIHLIDPIPFTRAEIPADLSELGATLDDEWILHAASQDLPCLAEVGLLPKALFDTELAGRLLGYPRVSLGTLVETLLGVRLAKEHSAADWSQRPLPDSWLTYAALDVELLAELREKLQAELAAAGKEAWAAEEFAALAAGAGVPAPPRTDPWRRTSGIHALRTPRALNVVKCLWTARDEIARKLDKSPSKILIDKAIAEVAAIDQPGRQHLRTIEAFSRRQAKRYEANWVDALARAAGTPRSELPPMHLLAEGPPAPRSWARRDPVAAERLNRVREHVTALAEDLNLPTENLISPDSVRRLAWRPPSTLDPASVDVTLAELGARRWQRQLLAPALARLLADS
ncbi:MAG: HRDC domain-containing protein [Propionibacteriales bacterium]|nr:HRDC domain-containing protein [Propionibacteriales bacterium]